MKRIGKKALCILLTLVMALGLLPGAALAEDEKTAWVTTEQDLIDALKDDATTMIVLLRDVSLTKPLVVNRTVELELYDGLLSYRGAGAAVQVKSGTLTLSEGQLSVRAESVRAETGDACGVSVADGAAFEASAVEIVVYSKSGDACGVSSEGNAAITIQDYATVRAQSDGGAACAVLMTGGSLKADYAVLSALSAQGKTAYAIDAGGADVTVDRCYVVGQSKTAADGYAPAGAIRTTGAVSIETALPDIFASSSAIYGTLDIPQQSDLRDGYYSVDPKEYLGAAYTTEPADEYIYVEHEDGIQKLDGFHYHVLPADSVARIGRKYYGTLSEAFNEAKAGDEVVLLSDLTLQSDVVIPGATSASSTAKTLHLNMNGHSIAGNGTACLTVGDAKMLALTIRDAANTSKASNVPIEVKPNSYLTIESGKFDVLPTYAVAGEAAKHIFITGGAFKVDPTALCVPGVTAKLSGGYYMATRADGNVIVVIGDRVLSYETATAAFKALNAYAAAGDVITAVMSFNGPALLKEDVTLGPKLDLTMVYNETYRNKSCISGEGKPTLTVAGAKITSGDTVCPPYGLLMDGVDLVVESGEITAKTGNDAKKTYVNAVQVKNGNVTVSGGTIYADGNRSYEDRTDDRQVTKYTYKGKPLTAAYSDNSATGIDVTNGSATISGGSILAVGSSAGGVSVDQDGSGITMSGGDVTALCYCHAGDNGSESYPNDYFQYSYGLRADYYERMIVSVSGGTVKACGSFAHGVSHNAGGKVIVGENAEISAEGTAKAYGIVSHYVTITGGDIQAVCNVPESRPTWRGHYNAVGVQLDYPRDDDRGPSVTGATITAKATNDGEACGIFSKGYNDWEREHSPVLTVENCTVSANAADGFACAVNNDGGFRTDIRGGEYSAVCADGFADCVCVYYSGDLDIAGGSFTVQGVPGTSAYSKETYAATCVYNQSNGKTTIRGGDFLMKDKNGTVVSSKNQGTDPSAGDYGAYRLLRVQNPAPERYDEASREYKPSAEPTLTVYGGRFSDKISLTSPDVVAAGYQVLETGDAEYPWTVGTAYVPYDPSASSASAPTISETKNGAVTVDPKAPKAGDEVTITAKPDAGYEVDAVTVTDADGKAVPVTKNADGTYTYTQPKGKVTVTATFKEKAKESADGAAGEALLGQFTDLDPKAWYRDGVLWALENGVMNGVGDGKFDPGGTTTRGMIVTILYRLEGEPVIRFGMPFSDVKESDWYARAVSWAESLGIVNGFEDGAFRPNDPITREQLAAILYRYAQYKGEGFQGLWSFRLDFPDAGEVSDWATEAMSWMVMNGVINGKDGFLAPGGEASRAEAATMLMRFCEKLAGS